MTLFFINFFILIKTQGEQIFGNRNRRSLSLSDFDAFDGIQPDNTPKNGENIIKGLNYDKCGDDVVMQEKKQNVVMQEKKETKRSKSKKESQRRSKHVDKDRKKSDIPNDENFKKMNMSKKIIKK